MAILVCMNVHPYTVMCGILALRKPLWYSPLFSAPPQNPHAVSPDHLSLLLYGIANQGHDLVPDFVANLLHDIIRRPDTTPAAVARLAGAVILMFQDDPDTLRQMAPLLRALLYAHRSRMAEGMEEVVAVKLTRVHLFLLVRCPDVVPLLTDAEQALMMPFNMQAMARTASKALEALEVDPNMPAWPYMSPIAILNEPRLAAAVRVELPEYAAPSPAYADALQKSWSTRWHSPSSAPPGVECEQPGAIRVPLPHTRSTPSLHTGLLCDVYRLLKRMELVEVLPLKSTVGPTIWTEILCRHQGVLFAIEFDTAWTRFQTNWEVVRPAVRMLRTLIEGQGVPVVTMSEAMWDYAWTDKARADMLSKLIHAAVFTHAQQEVASAQG